MKILLVHGRGQGGKDPDTLRDVWLEALDKGLHAAGLKGLPSQIEVAFPFYGDELDKFAGALGLPEDTAIAPKGSPALDEYAEFRAKIVLEMLAETKMSGAQAQAEANQLLKAKGMQNWAWVQAILRLIDRNSAATSEKTIEVFLRDVFLYCRRRKVQEEIDKIVSNALTPDTSVVVAHSLGTVVAYNVLHSAKAKVPLFVTIGSPLAIRAIRSSLTPLENPAGERGWYNAYDPSDVVSLYPLDANNFAVKPSIKKNVVVENWTENRHGIIGYLDNAEVASTIHSGLT